MLPRNTNGKGRAGTLTALEGFSFPHYFPCALL